MGGVKRAATEVKLSDVVVAVAVDEFRGSVLGKLHDYVRFAE
jgi:hypothetical protein